MATVIIGDAAQEGFLLLPVRIQERMEAIFTGFAEDWPAVSGVKALRGEMVGYYRKRTGDYRLFFRASDRTADATITIVRVGHRKDVYDE